jgi:Zn-dependent protease
MEYQRVGFQGALFAVAALLCLFACVILHELGHCLAARRFGIGTNSITLYPIGGVARLDAMPSEPLHEILIAIAGPAVNVALALLLFPLVWWGGIPQESDTLPAPSAIALVDTVFAANVAMFLFNLLPAFPMDGGRVFRAILAIGGNYTEATVIASRIGQGVAMLFILCGSGALTRWVPDLVFMPTLLLIGVFIFFSAAAERRMVKRVAARRQQREALP